MMKKIFLISICSALMALLANAQSGSTRSTERHFWGAIADASSGDLTNINELKENYSKLLLSWRMLPTESYETAFDVYRQTASGWEKINPEPIVNSTNFQVPDEHVDDAVDNTYKLCYAGTETALDTYTISADQLANKRPYVSIFIQETTSDTRINDVDEYVINDGGVADLDGDGNYEILVKRHAHGYENETVPNSPAILEAYKMDGTFLWRLVFGPNISNGNGCVFVAADFNGDGKDEVAIRTSEGTYFGDNAYIGDTNGDGQIDYAQPGEYNSEAPEFISIVDGMTGAELARAPHIAIGTSEEWGDNYFKRANSLRLAGAKLIPGNDWQIVTCRGVYDKMVLEAWKYNGPGQDMTKLWRFDTDSANVDDGYVGQGNHQLSVADVDGDGFDEITYGACAIDHDGTGLYTTELGHGDMLHVGKFDPNRPGLQTYQCYESGLTRSSLRDAHTGEQLWALMGTQPGDEGRALIADIDPESPGYEAWVYDRVVYDINGNPTGGANASMVNFPIWWTGSLNRQLFDDRTINQYNREGGNNRVFTMYRYDVACANSTKNNVVFMGDMLGDWREEIIMARRHPTDMSSNNRPLPSSTELMIFSTWHPTEHKFPYLMSDDVYYRCAVHQNVGYNSPNHLGFYLGPDLVEPPISPNQQAEKYWLGETNLAWDQTTSNWLDNAGVTATFSDGDVVMFDARGNSTDTIALAADMAPSKAWFVTPYGKDYTVAGPGRLADTMALLKLQEGTLTLSGNHTYTGTTTVVEGLFRMDGQLNSPVVVKTKGNIGGRGAILSGLTMAKGKSPVDAGIRPGFGNTAENDLGTLTVTGDVTLPGGNNLAFDVLPGTTTLNDSLVVDGDLIVDSVNNLIVTFPDDQPVAGNYTLVSVTGTLQATEANFNLIGVTGRPFSLVVTSDKIELIIPEQREPTSVVWEGNVDNIWNYTTPNFLLDSTATEFVFEDSVAFNEHAQRKDVVLDEAVTTGELTFESGDYTLSGTGSVAGIGGIRLVGTDPKSLTMVLSNNTYIGKNVFNNGVVTIQHIGMAGEPSSLGAGPVDADHIVLNGATLAIQEHSVTNRGITVIDTSTVDIPLDKELNLSGDLAGSGHLIKTGEGAVLLQGEKSFEGVTHIKEGMISLLNKEANEGAVGSKVILDGGTLRLQDARDYAAIAWDLEVPEGAEGTIRTDGRSTMLGTLTGGGVLNVDIPYVRTDFEGDWSAFTGTLNILGSSGDFRIGNSASYPHAELNLQKGSIYPITAAAARAGIQLGALSGVENTTLRGHGSLMTDFTVGGKNTDATFGGNIGSNVALIKVGTGTWTLTGNNTTTGAVTIREGRVLVNNAPGNVGIGTGTVTVQNGAIIGGTGSVAGELVVEAGATLQPGSDGVGTLTGESGVFLASGARVEVDISKNATGSDSVLVGGELTYGGTLVVTHVGEADLVEGDRFALFDAATASGDFAAFVPTTPGDGLLWDFDVATGTLYVIADTVAKSEQTIDFPEMNAKTLGDAPFDPQAFATSGLPVTYASSDESIAEVVNGRIELRGAGTVTITASQAGNEEWAAAPDVSRTLTVLAADWPVVSKVISPNGDGENDVLIIEGIEWYPENQFVIMHHSGREVYRVEGYNNEDKVFDGRTPYNRRLPRGTYFYILDIEHDGQVHRQKGWFILKYR